MFTFSHYNRERPWKYDQFARITARDAAKFLIAAYFALPDDQRPETVWISPQGQGMVVIDLLKKAGVRVSESYGTLPSTSSRLSSTASV